MKKTLIAIMFMVGCCAAQSDNGGYGLTIPDSPTNCVSAENAKDQNIYFGRCVEDLRVCVGFLASSPLSLLSQGKEVECSKEMQKNVETMLLLYSKLTESRHDVNVLSKLSEELSNQLVEIKRSAERRNDKEVLSIIANHENATMKFYGELKRMLEENWDGPTSATIAVCADGNHKNVSCDDLTALYCYGDGCGGTGIPTPKSVGKFTPLSPSR